MKLLQHYIKTPLDHEYTKQVDYSDAESANNSDDLLVEKNGISSKHCDKHLETDNILSQER